MRLLILQDPDAVADYVAAYIKRRIAEFNPTPQRPFVLGLPTGSSPVATYKRLVEFYKRGELSFRNVVTFNMDEYVGLPEDHPESYHSFMWKHLFRHVDIKPENVHILDGNAKDLEAECMRYEREISRAGGVELFLAGIGPDGHIAFNEPGSSLTSRTRVKTLAYDTVVANSRFFEGDVTKVPKSALTVGVGTVMDAREVVVIITGIHKAAALAKCVEEGVNHMWTLSMLQLHPRAAIVCDEDATLELRVRTVKYFKGIQETMEKQGACMDGDAAAHRFAKSYVPNPYAALARALRTPASMELSASPVTPLDGSAAPEGSDAAGAGEAAGSSAADTATAGSNATSPPVKAKAVSFPDGEGEQASSGRKRGQAANGEQRAKRARA